MNSPQVVLGAGPLGLATLHALAAKDIPAILVSRRRPLGLDVQAHHHSLDLRDVLALANLLSGCGTAYFCAQPPYHRWQQEFFGLQQAVLQACRLAGCSLVVADNLYGYGLPEAGQKLQESTPQRPTTRKGRVRAAMAAAALAAHAAGDVRVAIARASDLFGPSVRLSALGERVWRPLLAGRSVRFAGDPEQPHSYAYIGDFAAALANLGLRGRGWGEIWHVPHQPLQSTRALLLQAAAAHDLPAPRIVREGRLALRVAGLFIPAAGEIIEMLPQFEQPYAVDDSRWLHQRGLCATPLTQALHNTLAWYADDRQRSVALQRPYPGRAH